MIYNLYISVKLSHGGSVKINFKNIILNFLNEIFTFCRHISINYSPTKKICKSTPDQFLLCCTLAI